LSFLNGSRIMTNSMNNGRSIICKKDTKMFFRRVNEFSKAKLNISHIARDGNRNMKINQAIVTIFTTNIIYNYVKAKFC
jgi:hypothetical protein